jgi:hypothetical protein
MDKDKMELLKVEYSYFFSLAYDFLKRKPNDVDEIKIRNYSFSKKKVPLRTP